MQLLPSNIKRHRPWVRRRTWTWLFELSVSIRHRSGGDVYQSFVRSSVWCGGNDDWCSSHGGTRRLEAVSASPGKSWHFLFADSQPRSRLLFGASWEGFGSARTLRFKSIYMARPTGLLRRRSAPCPSGCRFAPASSPAARFEPWGSNPSAGPSDTKKPRKRGLFVSGAPDRIRTFGEFTSIAPYVGSIDIAI